MPLGSTLRRALFSRAARSRWMFVLVLLAAVVLALALAPWSIELRTSGWDKGDHVAAFATLAVCSLFAWRGHPAVHRGVALGLIAFGIAIEFAQTLVPGRMADWRDVVADALGVLLGLSLASWIAHRMDRRTQARPDDRP